MPQRVVIRLESVLMRLRALPKSCGLPAIWLRSALLLKVRYKELRPEKKISTPMSLSRYVRLIRACACTHHDSSASVMTLLLLKCLTCWKIMLSAASSCCQRQAGWPRVTKMCAGARAVEKCLKEAKHQKIASGDADWLAWTGFAIVCWSSSSGGFPNAS